MKEKMTLRPLCTFLALLFIAFTATAQSNQPAVFTSSTELLLVTTHDWSTVEGQLQRYERAKTDKKWKPVGAPVTVALGKKGMGWGRGLAEIPKTRKAADPVKKEGDGKSPAGIFSLSSAFGYAEKAESGWKMPYLSLTPGVECVDDAGSKFYARVVDRATVTADWKSSEVMRKAPEYEIGLIIAHNANPITVGGGSCIFMHIWDGAGVGTSGCTAMPREQLEPVIAWLDPAKNPLLVQLPIEQYKKLKKSWKLPGLPKQ